LHGLSPVGYSAIVVVCCAHLPFGGQAQLSLLRCCNGSIVTAASFMLLLDGERELCMHSVQGVLHVGLQYRCGRNQCTESASDQQLLWCGKVAVT
jgi:hypothetical protein